MNDSINQAQKTGYVEVSTQQWRENNLTSVTDNIVDERPIALVYNGISQAVMMATPCDLEDFALGFSLSEGIIDTVDQVFDLQVEQHHNGYEINLDISGQKMAALKSYRRNMTGKTGCGLCGAESLAGAIRPGKIVQPQALPGHTAIQLAIESLSSWQRIQAMTGACHAALWCNPDGSKALLREDVGRHNAFDKLIGAMAKSHISTSSGFAVISSRASYEMVHKASFLGCSTLIAISAPTTMALEQAKELNINLLGFARNGRHNIYHSVNH